MRKLCEPPREVSLLRDHRSFDTIYECKQYLVQRRKQQQDTCAIVNEIAANVRVRSASESRLSGVRRLPPKKPPTQLPPRQPSSTRRGNVQQRSSGWLHSSSARVHSVMSDSLRVHVICTAFCTVSSTVSAVTVV